MRALNLKQQIIFVPKATHGSIKNEPSLGQVLFLPVIVAGLKDEAARAKLRPLLEVASVADEQLMEKGYSDYVRRGRTPKYDGFSWQERGKD